MLPRILVLVLCCTLLSCKNFVEKYKRSNSGLSSLDRQVLYDFRNSPTPSVHACPAPPAAACSTVLGNASGSFTYAAENEQACLYRCGTTNTLAVFSGTKMQASSETAYSSIAATFDLNRDDKNELLLLGETSHNGEFSREASLQTFEKNTLHPVEDFGIVYHDSCVLFAGVDEAKRQKLITSGLTPNVEAVVIYYLPHPNREMPSFTAERYRAPCPATSNIAPSGWQLVSR